MHDDLLMAAALRRLDLAQHGADGTDPDGLGVAVVVAAVDPAAFIAGAIDFCFAVPPDLRGAWQRTYTRTIFLAGLPATVALRHRHRHVTPDGGLAWHGPAADLHGLSRLLRAFQGPAPVRPPAGRLTVTLPGPATGHTARALVATDGVSVGDYLVHLHHLVAEATLRGLLRPGDVLHTEHRPVLGDADVGAALDASLAHTTHTRITQDPRDPGRLRLYAVLTSDRGRPHQGER